MPHHQSGLLRRPGPRHNYHFGGGDMQHQHHPQGGGFPLRHGPGGYYNMPPQQHPMLGAAAGPPQVLPSQGRPMKIGGFRGAHGLGGMHGGNPMMRATVAQ